MTSALFSFLHFVTAFGLVGTLVLEWAVFNASPTYREARLLQIFDRWYGIFAVLMLGAGFLRVFYFEKGSAYYFASPFFQAKLAVFAVIGLLSIYPTIRFIKWRTSMSDGTPPRVAAAEYKTIRAILNLELLLLPVLLLCATLMAKGIGA